MEITFVTTELAPFVKVGGLADVSAALPKALRSLGHAVTLVMPRFAELEQQGLLLARRLTPLRFTLGDRSPLGSAETIWSAWRRTTASPGVTRKS